MFELLSLLIDYNWLSIILWTAAFIVLSLGSLGPLVGWCLRLLWDFINEATGSPNLYFSYLYSKKPEEPEEPEELGYRVIELSQGWVLQRTKDHKYYDPMDGAFWPSIFNSSHYDTKKSATLTAAKLSKSTLLIGSSSLSSDECLWCENVQNVLLISGVLVALGALLNYMLYPTLLIGSIVATIYGMRALRRVQKATSVILQDLKEHKSLSSDEAHSTEEPAKPKEPKEPKEYTIVPLGDKYVIQRVSDHKYYYATDKRFFHSTYTGSLFMGRIDAARVMAELINK